ncbi:hypothetical protein M427DRAFT_53777 [Gonapodya prolifera JEL478]|uniref:Non-structural maintenance of chromosomes element 1 homolog n=1 Tax=Gonapodya prolifera (strain JEL478) TaxID=1344416 RepID=A0A139ANT6_GONPJ|nr:hypothetical protein M427DRAFT_53777 [Gonapodya prolifera JEL478]|eukprot:KXS18388.1 hypothetical protein M427DRAFT_53777 [Gonapodya prolifera JEL478]
MDEDCKSSAERQIYPQQMVAAFGDEHRLFLQAIISRRFLEEEELRQCHRDACQKTDVDPGTLSDFVRSVNDKLQLIDLELKKGKDPDGSVYYALVNTRRDAISQLATGYEDHQILFLKHLLELLVDAPEELYEVGSLKILHSLKSIKFTGRKKLSEKDCEEFMNQLVADHWIVEPTKGRYHLSVRSILELKPYLLENFDEIAPCEACKEIIVTKHSEACANPNCPLRMHSSCATLRFARVSLANRNCPSCGEKWVGDWRGQKDDERIAKVRQGGQKKLRGEDEEDGMQNDEEEDE